MACVNAGDTSEKRLSPLSPPDPSNTPPGMEEDSSMSTPRVHLAATDATHPYRLLLTVEEAAHALGMGRTVIFEQVRLGRLKSVKVGRARRIPLDYIEDFITLLKTEAENEEAA